MTDTVSSFSNLENVVFSDIPSFTEFGQHTNGENLEKNGIRVGVLDAPLSSGDAMPKADGVNVQHIGQSLQTDSGGMILANQADIKSGEPQFQFSDKMPQAGNASDIKLENEDSLSALSKGKPVVDRTTIQYSQLDSTRVNGGKEDVIILRSGSDSKVSDSSRVMDEVASVSSNRQVQFSEKMVQAGNTSEIQQKSDNLQSDLNSEKNSRSLSPLHSDPEVVSNVSHSPSKGTVEIPRENLAKGTETRMMEMDLPDQILENQDLLRVMKRNKQTSENRFVSIWNKADGTGIGPQTIAALNGSERNEANGFSKEIDHLFDDIISGSVNSEEKVIKSSANKSMYSDNPGTSDRFSMLNQTNTSSANSVPQREDATATRFPPNVVETVGKEIAAFLQRGDRILKLQLKPAELGTVNIEMDTKGNVVKLSIVAETSSARELFLSNQNELRRVLEGHGVRLEKSVSSNRQVQFSEKMVQAGNTSEIQQKSDNLQSDLNSEKNSRSLSPLHSEPEVVSNVSHSPSKGTVEIPRENLAKGTETRMMEMDLSDQILENQDLLRVVKRNKQTSENRFVSIWNKADGTGIGPQTIAALNGSERNEANGFSKEIDHLIDDIISGSVNSEEKVIKSSANKSMYSDNPGTSDRFSMLNQTNTSSANSVSQRKNATATRFPPNVVETVGKEIAAFLQRGDRILKLQLKPAELGTVNIEMDTKENVVKLSIVAETSSARELFLSNHNELRRVLEGHGVRLENLDVQVNDGHGQSMADGNNGSDRQQNQRWGTRFARMDIVDDSGDTILPMRQNNDGLLDLLV